MPAVALGALMVGGSLLSAHAQKKAAAKQQQAVQEANAANVAAHTMTPEEKAQYFASGVSRINRSLDTATDSASRALAARGLGGNQLATPIANIARSRLPAIGDLHGNLVQTAMNMRAGTPAATPAPAPMSTASYFMGSMGPVMEGVGGYGVGQKISKYFG